MEGVWQKTDPLEVVLYEKTLFFVQALFANIHCHEEINKIKIPLFNKCSQVLLQQCDPDDVKYKICFATL